MGTQKARIREEEETPSRGCRFLEGGLSPLLEEGRSIDLDGGLSGATLISVFGCLISTLEATAATLGSDAFSKDFLAPAPLLFALSES